jgi:Tol biopolymer transport system component
VPVLGGTPRVLVEGNEARPAGDFSWSPDGTRAAYVHGDAILLRGAEGREVVELVRDGEAHSLAWSPDGRWLAYVSGNREFAFSETLLGNIAPSRLWVVATAGGSDPIALTDGQALVASPVWTGPRRVLYASGGGATRDIHALSLSGRGRPVGTPMRLTTGLRLHSVALGPGGGSLIYVLLDHVANVASLALPGDGEPAASIADATFVTEGDQVVEDMDVLPGGGWLLFDSNRGGSQDIWLQSGRGSNPVQLTTDPSDEFGPTWSPDGREVAYYAVRDGVRHIFVMRATGQDVVQVTADSLQDQQPKWSPDGESLVFYRRDGAGRDRLFVTTRSADSTWGEPRLLTEEPGTGSAWSSDGRWIAFTDQAGNLRVVDATGGPSRLLAGPADVGGLPIRRPHWLWGEPAMLARVEGPGGTGGIWRFSIAGDPPVELVRLDDPDRPVHRADLAADTDRVYLLVSEFGSSLWSIPVGTER